MMKPTVEDVVNALITLSTADKETKRQAKEVLVEMQTKIEKNRKGVPY